MPRAALVSLSAALARLSAALVWLPAAALAWPLAACGNVEEPDPLIQGCSFYAAMDEETWNGTAGEVKDSCGGDDNGKALDGVVTVPNGKRGRAALFPMSRKGCIEVPDSINLRPTDALTMSAWVNPTGLMGGDQEALGIISKRSGKDLDDSYNLSLWTNDKAWVELQNSDDRMGGNTTIMNGRWTQITAVYDGTKLPSERVRLYINGTQDRVLSETANALSSAAIPLRIGCMIGLNSSNMTTTQSFVGQMDDVVIWKRPLSGDEVTAWYRATDPAE